VRGYGYVQFQDPFDATLVAAEIERLHIYKECGEGRVIDGVVEVQRDTKNLTQVFLRSVPTWANETDLKTCLQRTIQSHGVRIENVILPRKHILVHNEALFNSFQRALVQKLQPSDIKEGDYEITTATPGEKSYDFVAFLKFRDSAKARTARDLLNTVHFNKSYMDAALLLKIEFILPSVVNEFCECHLGAKSDSLQRASKSPIKINSKQWKGSAMTTVETTCVDDLVLAREKLAPLLAGRQVSLTRKQMSFAKSTTGIRQIAALEHDMCVKTRVDDRQSSLFIYARDGAMATAAETALMNLLSTKTADVLQDISLRDAEYPRGLMKAIKAFFIY